MAARAIIAKAAAMNVVAPVARYALHLQLGRIARASVAGRADKPLVFSGQREGRGGVMIEFPRLPVRRRVALLALGR